MLIMIIKVPGPPVHGAGEGEQAEGSRAHGGALGVADLPRVMLVSEVYSLCVNF